MLLFDENDTSDWQHSFHETRTSELSDDQHDQDDNTDHMQQPDTDIPGVWKWQVEWKSDLYADRTGKLMDPEKVVRGRLTGLKHMNYHHVYDWIDEASIPKGTKVETSRWCDDFNPRDGDETNVRSRIVVQQCNVVKRDEVHQGTPPLKVLRMLLALATDLWIPWPHRLTWGSSESHDAIQSILVVAVALRQPIDRSAAPDARKGSQ